MSTKVKPAGGCQWELSTLVEMGIFIINIVQNGWYMVIMKSRLIFSQLYYCFQILYRRCSPLLPFLPNIQKWRKKMDKCNLLLTQGKGRMGKKSSLSAYFTYPKVQKCRNPFHSNRKGLWRPTITLGSAPCKDLSCPLSSWASGFTLWDYIPCPLCLVCRRTSSWALHIFSSLMYYVSIPNPITGQETGFKMIDLMKWMAM